MSKAKKFLGLIMFILLIACAVGNVLILFSDYKASFSHTSALIAFIAIISAIYYAVRGYSKHAAPSYKAYMIICALYFQSFTADIGDNGIAEYGLEKYEVATMVLITCLLFGLMLILFFAKDVGEQKTSLICIIALAGALASLILTLIGKGHFANDDVVFFLLHKSTTSVLLVLVASFMAKLKYIDKAERGTK